MNNKNPQRRLMLVLIAILVVVGAALLLILHPKRARYRTSFLQRGGISVSVSATGTVNPVNQVTVGSQVSGTVLKTCFDFNDYVKAGQVLATIDPRNYESALKQAEANLASAKASLNQDKLTAVRAETLYSAGLMSYSDYLQAKTDYELDAAKLQQVQASYEQAQTNLAYTTITAPMSGIVVARKVEPGQTVAASFTAPELFNIADLSLMQVEVSIDEADVGKLDTALVATFNVDAYPESTFEGRIVQVRNEPVTSSNVTTYIAIVRVANPGLLLKPGMTANVKITVKSANDVLTVPNSALSLKLASTLGFSSVATSRTSGSGAAGTRVSAPRDPDFHGGPAQPGGLPPGAAVAESGRASPQAATTATTGRTTASTKTVFVLENGRPMPRPVEIGIADGSNTEIISGLKEGELVITGLGQGKSSNGTSTQQNRMPMMGGFGGPPPGGR
jgi:HlyD family secretion protein